MTQDPEGADREGLAAAEPASAGSEGEGFVARWSRRKREARGGPVAPEADAIVSAGSGSTPETDSPLPLSTVPPVDGPNDPSAEQEAPPPLDSMDGESDYSAFLSPKVSEELRRLALRKLFGSSKFNLRDGLDDYDDDYRIFESLGDIVTADMHHRMGLTSAQGEQAPSAERAPASDVANEATVEPGTSEQGLVDKQGVVPDRGGSAAEQSARNAYPRDTSVGDET